ncbi:hypothetical protein FCH28_09690 [Streptomyces piniterrae]|uniref:Uncharacterized protein n=1 Tax=Streptomyces piniterrae TaxID=2571125 RepID=A0A4U0NMF0_9ACTN|nr:hypothetical protein [Streptomyces piniterrae]TJZ55601.1 hypothetical protein FCH28_09690 [Streptomyces piniterrae]
MSAGDHLSRLGDGAGALARSYSQWLGADGPATGVKRLVGSVAGGAFTVMLLDGTRPLIWVAAGGGLAAAYYAGRLDEGEQAAEDAEPVDVLAAVWKAVGDDRGALLTVLRDVFCASTTKEVRALLAEADIRVREGVRTTRGNGPGVHRDDLPPLPSPSDEGPVGVVAAGEDANTNANNTTITKIGQGGYSVQKGTQPAR